MIQKLDGVADEITFVTFDYPRATKVEDLFNLSTNENKHYNDSWQTAIGEELQSLSSDEILVVTGSLYFISMVKPFLVERISKRN